MSEENYKERPCLHRDVCSEHQNMLYMIKYSLDDVKEIKNEIKEISELVLRETGILNGMYLSIKILVSIVSIIAGYLAIVNNVVWK